MAAVKSKDTTPELQVRRLVHAMGYRYRLHVRSLPGAPDLVFARLRKVIMVHGCFWHQHRCARGDRMPRSRVQYWRQKLEGNKRRDVKYRRMLNRMGWRVLTVWECQTHPKKLDQLADRITKFLEDC